MTGRPTKLTRHTLDKICTALRAGNYLDVAAAYAGVPKTTLRDWLRRGANSSTGIYRQFSLAVTEAMAAAEVADVAVIAKASRAGDYRAALARIERKHPDRWAKKTVIYMGDADKPMQSAELDLSNLSDAELRTLQEIMKKGARKGSKETA